MAASYPVSVKSFSAKTDGPSQTIFAAHINDPQDEIVAVEGGLLNGVAHALKPSVDNAQDLGTAGLRWGIARAKGLQLNDATTLTLATDAVTVTQSYHAIDTEAAAATDNCATLTAGTGVAAGFVLHLRAANVAHVVTMKDGTGNLLLNGDYAMSTTDATISLIYDGTNWRELGRSVTTTTAPPVKIYAPTIADVSNTNVETTTLSFSVPAAEMADGDAIDIYLLVEVKNATGATTPTLKFKWGATSITLTTVAWSANGPVVHMLRMTVQRLGADLYITSPNSTSTQGFNWTSDMTNVAGAQKMVAPTFSSTQTVVLTVTFSAADANRWWKTQAARILKVAGV